MSHITRRRPGGTVFRISADQARADAIVPTRFRRLQATALRPFLFSDCRPGLGLLIEPGDVLAVDGHLGLGFEGDLEARALRATGLQAVIAATSDRAFVQSASRAGLLVLENAAAAKAIREGTRVRIDIETGLVHDLSNDEWYRSNPPGRLQQLALDAMSRRAPTATFAGDRCA